MVRQKPAVPSSSQNANFSVYWVQKGRWFTALFCYEGQKNNEVEDGKRKITPQQIDAAVFGTQNNVAYLEPAYSGVLSAFRRKYSRDLKNVEGVIWGVPMDLATSYRPGTRFGPAAIRKISAMWEPADAQWPYKFSPFNELSLVDYGDAFWDYTYPETILPAIEQQAAEI